MKVLVTGANGYIGQGVVSALINKGINVIATDFVADKIDSRANIKMTNLFKVENPYEYFDKPDILIHLAWRDGFKHDSLAHINDFASHYEFIEKMSFAGIHKIVVMGSVHEIGFYEGSVDENTPCNPQSLYGISKNALRQAVQLITSRNGNLFQWIRGYYIVGNTTSGCSVFSKITQAETEGKSEFPFTQGLNQFDFLGYEDFCEYVALISIQDEVTGIINCCSGRPEKIADRVEQFIKQNNYSIALKYGAFPDRPYDSKAIWGNDDKLRKILGKE